MINPRITDTGHRLIAAQDKRLFYVPDFSQQNALYREFGQNSEIDIMRSHPEYEGIINSKLQKVSDIGLDTSQFTDEQMLEGIIGRSYDENEVREMLDQSASARKSELSQNSKKD